MAGLFETSDRFGPFASGTGGSQRDLANSIFSVDAKNTPLVAMIPKAEGVVNTTYEYPVDNQLSPKHNATKDDFDVSELNGKDDFDNALPNYSVIQNNVQWFRRASLIGKLAESASNLAGAADLRAVSIRKQLEAIKRDMEVRMCADDVLNTADPVTKFYNADVRTSSSNALMTRALGSYIDNDNSNIPTGFQTPAASIKTGAVDSLTESDVQDVLQSIYEQTGISKELTLLCGVNLKKQFRNFTQLATEGTDNKAATRIRTFNQDAEDRSIISTVDVFEGDFGTLTLVPTLWNMKTDWSNDERTASGGSGSRNTTTYSDTAGKGVGYCLDLDFLEMRFHELPSVTPLPNLGAGERYEVSAIAGLSVLNPLAFGAFKTTT